MTALMERLTGTTADLEGTPVTTPRPRIPGAPFWIGCYGLDPACPVADVVFAARLASVACAFHVYGVVGVRSPVLVRSDAEKWEKWLLEAKGDTDGWLRRYALRLACERFPSVPAEDVLQTAKYLHDAFTPR